MTKQEKYDKQLSTEHELINRKLTWLLSSQSILFAALALVISMDLKLPQQFSKVIAILGILISSLIWVGVVMSIVAKVLIWKDYNKEPLNNVGLGVRNWITFIALIPDFFMPLAFVFAWWYLLFFGISS